MSQGEATYSKFMRQYVNNPGQMEGQCIQGGAFHTRGHYRYVYVSDRKLFSFGSHYLMCMFRDGYALVNSDTYSKCTSNQLRQLHIALEGIKVVPFRNIGKDEDLSTSGPRLRNFLRVAELTLVGHLVGSLGRPHDLRERCSEILDYRKHPEMILSVLSEHTKGFLEGAYGTSDLGELLNKCQEEDLPDLFDIYRMVKDVNHVPKTRAGKAVGLLIGRQKKYPYAHFHKLVEGFLYDLENFGIEVAAVNIAPLDGGEILATL